MTMPRSTTKSGQSVSGKVTAKKVRLQAPVRKPPAPRGSKKSTRDYLKDVLQEEPSMAISFGNTGLDGMN